MHLTLIKNTDESKKILYKIARIVYAETDASSLAAVEAFASMIANICITDKKQFNDIASDKNIFECLDPKSKRHQKINVDANDREFNVCVRVVRRMMNGDLPNACFGATRFHHDDASPDWATARGYIVQVDNLLFYL